MCVRDIDEDGDLENDGGYDVFLTGGNMLVSHDSDDVNEDENGYMMRGRRGRERDIDQ